MTRRSRPPVEVFATEEEARVYRARALQLMVEAGFLRDLRRRNPPITLGALSRATQITVPRICDLERGRAQPDEAELTAMARVFFGHNEGGGIGW